ncbi:MAG: RNA methyltransferase, partial [Cyanobacteria bacterium P01_G01_bin.49]
RFKKRSSIDINNPNILINAHLYENRCLLSLDSSGESLHRRGYRPAMGLAPLKETLAAALLDLTNWTADLPFLDPLCGSGILPIEAAFKSLNIAPGLIRNSFAFQHWHDFDKLLYEKIIEEAKNSRKQTIEAPIFGSDKDLEIIKQAKINTEKCHLNQYINLTKIDLKNLEAPRDQGVIICNPPYGKRLGNPQELAALYTLLGDILKQRFKGWIAYILTSNKELGKKIGLRTSRRIPIYNGSLPCTLLKYELY